MTILVVWCTRKKTGANICAIIASTDYTPMSWWGAES